MKFYIREWVMSNGEKEGIVWDKSVNLSHLLYAIVIAGGALVWYSNLQSVIAVHSVEIQNLQKAAEIGDNRMIRIEAALADLKTLILERDGKPSKQSR